jgi:urocanate hydratase
VSKAQRVQKPQARPKNDFQRTNPTRNPKRPSQSKTLRYEHQPRAQTQGNPLTRRKKLALRNALRYFEPQHHKELIAEFSEELETYGRIYMYRFVPIMK